MSSAVYYSLREKGGKLAVYNDGLFLGLADSINFTGTVVGSIMGGMVTENITGMTPASVFTETPVGVIDGVNTIYTVTNTINIIFSFGINNALIQPTGQYAFSVVGNQITFTNPLDASFAGTPFTIVYA